MTERITAVLEVDFVWEPCEGHNIPGERAILGGWLLHRWRLPKGYCLTPLESDTDGTARLEAVVESFVAESGRGIRVYGHSSGTCSRNPGQRVACVWSQELNALQEFDEWAHKRAHRGGADA